MPDLHFELDPSENDRLASLCGQLNCHLKHIEGHLGVKIVQRSHSFSIRGPRHAAQQARAIVNRLFAMTAEKSDPISPADVHLALTSAPGFDHQTEHNGTPEVAEQEEVVIRLRKQLIRAQNPNQRAYLRRIQDNDINFGIGPAGTGKTFLAVACAVHALSENRVERILLVRPAVEAGEKLGFLPGDIGQKIDPYLRPLFDALYDMLGFDRVGKLVARGTIELAPLAYMRGRTLNESFVILDEAQNTTVEQMKMFLTRIGYGSRAIVTGDITQVDLPRGQLSGLRHAETVLRQLDGISFTHFAPRDVVRHALVQRIVEAYDSQPRE